ncbi:MAG: hypothetical protein ACJ790_06155 [Myxococcaceae bacterium]
MIIALVLFAACNVAAAMVLRRATPDEAMREQLTDIVARGRRGALPAVLLLVVGYLIWRQVDPVHAEPLYMSAIMLVLGVMLARVIYCWLSSIRVVKDDKPLRYRVAGAYSLELAGILLACAVARFL